MIQTCSVRMPGHPLWGLRPPSCLGRTDREKTVSQLRLDLDAMRENGGPSPGVECFQIPWRLVVQPQENLLEAPRADSMELMEAHAHGLGRYLVAHWAKCAMQVLLGLGTKRSSGRSTMMLAFHSKGYAAGARDGKVSDDDAWQSLRLLVINNVTWGPTQHSQGTYRRMAYPWLVPCFLAAPRRANMTAALLHWLALASIP